MRLSFGALGLLACGACAQSAQKMTPEAQAVLEQLQAALPPCPVQCLVPTVPASGCALTDTDCICSSQELAASSTACVGANCTVIEGLQTKRFQDEMCGLPVRSQQDITIRVCWALWAFAAVVVLGRFAARSKSFNGVGYGWDDWTAAVTMVFVTGIAISGYLMIRDGLGRDIWQLQPRNISAVLRWFWIEEILYCFAVSLTKISICLLYLRIFPDTVSQGFRYICYAVMGVLVCQLISFALSSAFQCRPVSYMWNQWDGEHRGTCINAMAQIYAGAGVNTFMDLVVFVLPIPRLLKVQISTRRKIGVCATFLVGLFVTLCSIIRLYYVVHWSATTNPTWTYSKIAFWSLVEVDVGMICCCMPALSGPLKKFWTGTVAKPLSDLYSRSKRTRTDTSGSMTASKAGSSGWKSMKGRTTDSKSGADTIMRNVTLNVSDELELVDKSARGKPDANQHSYPVDYTHDYRQDW